MCVLLLLLQFAATLCSQIIEIKSLYNTQVMDVFVETGSLLKYGDPIYTMRSSQWLGDDWALGEPRVISFISDNVDRNAVYRVKEATKALYSVYEEPQVLFRMEKQ
jgi:hypothetical protein